MTRRSVCPICMHFIQDGDLKYTAHKEGLVHADCYKGECYADQEQFDHDIATLYAVIGYLTYQPHYDKAEAAILRIEAHRPRR